MKARSPLIPRGTSPVIVIIIIIIVVVRGTSPLLLIIIIVFVLGSDAQHIAALKIDKNGPDATVLLDLDGIGHGASDGLDIDLKNAAVRNRPVGDLRRIVGLNLGPFDSFPLPRILAVLSGCL